ncbi:hypothetical protein D3C76_1574270 [compost metagenome]
MPYKDGAFWQMQRQAVSWKQQVKAKAGGRDVVNGYGYEIDRRSRLAGEGDFEDAFAGKPAPTEIGVLEKFVFHRVFHQLRQ